MGIDPEYFLDKMSLEGFALALEGYNEKLKITWEQTRLVSYWSVVGYLKNKSLKVFKRNQFKLTWDPIEKPEKPKKPLVDLYTRALNKFLSHGQKH